MILSHSKGLYRYAQALLQLNELDSAKEYAVQSYLVSEDKVCLELIKLIDERISENDPVSDYKFLGKVRGEDNGFGGI